MVKSLVFCVGRSCRACRGRPCAAKVELVALGKNAPPNKSNLPLRTLFPDAPFFAVELDISHIGSARAIGLIANRKPSQPAIRCRK